jgi:hypothetical protein
MMDQQLKWKSISHLGDEPKLAPKRLFLVGVPAFLAAIVLSIIVHEYSHLIAHRIVASAASVQAQGAPTIEQTARHSPVEELAGPFGTFLLAVVSFALFVRFPGNLFFSAMAFVNATARLPETLTLCLQLFFRRTTIVETEEGSLLSLLHLHSSTAALVILCFFSLTLLFMSITVIHESRSVPWKWLVALGMVGVFIPVQPLVARIIAPVLI